MKDKENNTFIARGISKESGEFVFGYYVEAQCKRIILPLNKRCEFRSILSGNRIELLETTYIEITQQPDRYAGTDDHGKFMYEKDKLRWNDTFGIVKYDKRKGFIAMFDRNGESYEIYLMENIKIIGNTHNIVNKELMEE